MTKRRTMEYVTPGEAEARTGIDATTIRKWADKRRIRGAKKIGTGKRGIWQIPVDQLDSLHALKAGKGTGRPMGSRNKNQPSELGD